jgi:DNA-binding MarR family transcriptional regulator
VAATPSGRRDARRSTTRAKSTSARFGDEQRALSTKVDFGPLDKYLGYYLRRLYDNYRKHFVAQAGDLDLQPREVGALFVIGLNPGLTPSQLIDAVGMDGAQITAVLNLFENRGLLERRVSSADARSRQVYLTAKGRKMLKRLGRFVEGFDRTFSGNSLNDDELRQLIDLLAKLHAGTDGI